MAVTIDQLDVEVSDGQPAQAAAAPQGPQKEKLDLQRALERVRERQARLKAD